MTFTSREFDPRAALMAVYDEARVEDDDRADTAESMCRNVIVELPAALPYKNADDESVKLPIRVAWNGGSGIVLEIGPYDFDGPSVQLLKQAIAFFEHTGGETKPVEMVPSRVTPNPSVTYPSDVPDNVVHLRPLQAMLAKHGEWF